MFIEGQGVPERFIRVEQSPMLVPSRQRPTPTASQSPVAAALSWSGSIANKRMRDGYCSVLASGFCRIRAGSSATTKIRHQACVLAISDGTRWQSTHARTRETRWAPPLFMPMRQISASQKCVLACSRWPRRRIRSGIPVFNDCVHHKGRAYVREAQATCSRANADTSLRPDCRLPWR